MFLAGTFVASGIAGAFAPWISDRLHALFVSAATAAQAETLVEMILPLGVGLVAAYLSARKRRIAKALA